MSNFTPESLRVRLCELEVAADHAAASVLEAQASHDATIKAAVLSGDIDAPAQTEAVLTAARSTQARAIKLVEEAKHQLVEAVKREKAAEQDAARIEIEAELADLAKMAAEIDRTFAEAVARAMEIRARELVLRLKARPLFGEVMGAPEIFNALRSTATYLRAAADGLRPDAPTSISKAAAIGAHQIRRTIR